VKHIGNTLITFILFGAMLFIHCAGSRSGQSSAPAFISIEEELTLGEDISSFTLRYLDIIRNRTLNGFLDDMAKKIGAGSNWSGLPYTVFVINSDEINHFSLPGGNIYLFRGLIENAETADEIAVILAHEIAHLSERDGVARIAEKYSFSFAAQSVIGENPEIAEHIIASLYKEATILDYPAAHEFRADQIALEYAQKANFNPRYLLLFLSKMEQIEKSHPLKTRLLRMTHPPTNARLKRTRKNLKKLSFPTQHSTEFAAAFQNAKRMLAQIPR